MNDASNVIISNNQSDLTRIKFAKANNKITTIVNVGDIIQKNNLQKSKINNSKQNSNEINYKEKKLDSSQNPKQINNYENNNINNNIQKNLNNSISFIEKNYFFLKLSRYCPLKVKIVIIIFHLICSILFLFINIYDYIIYWKNENYLRNKDCLINGTIIFIFQIIASLCILFFLFIIFFLNQGENHKFIISSILFIIIFSFLRIYIFLKRVKIQLSILLNLVYSISIFLINLVLFMFLMIISRKKKNVLQNIDEILYFTENNNNMQTQKKEKDINYNNNSPNTNILKKAKKSIQLVEDDNDIKKKN